MNSFVVQQREVDEEGRLGGGGGGGEWGRHHPTFKVPKEMKQCF